MYFVTLTSDMQMTQNKKIFKKQFPEISMKKKWVDSGLFNSLFYLNSFKLSGRVI